MAGISSNALKGMNYPENRLKYNGKELQNKEFNDGSGLEWYDYGARMYDAQMGRFFTQDRYAEKYYTMTPYQYGANNSINNIDVNGDSIWVTTNSGRLYYSYTTDGGYGFYSTTGTDSQTGLPIQTLYNGNDGFVKQVSGALGRLTLGKEGKSLVMEIAGSKNNMSIVATQGGNRTDPNGLGVFWNPGALTSGPDEKGNTQRPTFIGLGHEFAHQQNIWNGSLNQNPWVTQDDQGNSLPQPIPNDDISATNTENKIRAEQSIPLRTHYAVDVNGVPVNTTRILRAGTRESLYYNSNGQTNYNKLNKNQTPYKY